ncbi:transglutaminase domain-containing protein [Pseudobythopirellula maris]|uniref:transglutaminase domain-containing protein n=1 Tax=Pseudobythopirellula maris TaxID=2527991 RepID=UPI0018D4D5A7|nr:transglutaminase domain-containing protein [Pseudobythopirellula maris]
MPTIALALLASLWVASPLAAQLLETTEDGPLRYGDPVESRFRVGAEITARRGDCRNILAMVPVPLECAEQKVRIIDEEFTGDVERVAYRDVVGGEARQMLISVPYLPAGATAKAIVTFEIETRPVLHPGEEAVAGLVIPKRPSRELKRYLSTSPYIESRSGRIRRIVREVMEQLEEGDASESAAANAAADAEPLNDWRRLEALYDYVLDNIDYLEQPEDTSALQTLRDGEADCHGRSALFCALARAADAPARIVWVNGHAFAEFYLEDPESEQGWWFPIESAGSRCFGEMPLGRTIMQKGDNFRIPERPNDRLRYANDWLTGKPARGGGPPSVRYIRETL